jgi:hypothetical protein
MSYHQKLSKDYQLDSVCQHQLKTLFYDGISSDILDRDNVNYNPNEGIIIKIDGLKRDTDGVFYFDRSADTEKTTVPIQTIKKFTPISMTKLSLAQKNPQLPSLPGRIALKKPIIIVKKP